MGVSEDTPLNFRNGGGNEIHLAEFWILNYTYLLLKDIQKHDDVAVCRAVLRQCPSHLRAR